jgi:hypothetical protein
MESADTDRRTDKILSWIYGFSLLGIIAVLTAIVALGKVEERTSAGLQQMIGILAVLAGGWANGQFGKGRDRSPP